MKIREEIKEVYEKQIYRLLNVLGKNSGSVLTAESIRKYIEEEEEFIASSLLRKIVKEEIPCRRELI